mgnify:CR=1 FL=1
MTGQDTVKKLIVGEEDGKEKKTKRMRELVELLNKARRAYEQENTEIMSNFEYDRLMTNCCP